MDPRPSMVRWYSLPRLVSIGVRVAVSTVFGEFADRRDSMASERPLDPVNLDSELDYRAHQGADFWFDFAADSGDGWDSTYAVARLLGDPNLSVPNCPDGALPRGRILLFGGDQVYPTASTEQYLERFVAPFEQVHQNNPSAFVPEPDLYAVPGNHDWYDGLSSFLNLFCWRRRPGPWSQARRGHPIGGRRTKQIRSYFALALPHDWWLWGVDNQLTNYIDQQQINFFDHVARQWMNPGSKLILCTGRPEWSYVDVASPQAAFEHFSYVESLVGQVKKDHRVCAVLTGDSHHYSRYTEGDRHYIAAGGGGAFLHPTHHLKDVVDFAWDWPPPGTPVPPPVPPGQKPAPRFRRTFTLARDPLSKEPTVFPPRTTSWWITWRNLAFAFYNWDYAIALGLVCVLFAWLLNVNAHIAGSALPDILRAAGGFWPALCVYGGLFVASPWPSLLLAATAAGYYYFANYKSGWRFVAGITHALAQAGAMVLVTILCALHAPGAHEIIGLFAYALVLGGLSAATVMGLYLLVSLNGFGAHWNGAFSALRIKDYKCFLRLRIGNDKALTIYPIGLKHVPRDRSDPLANPELETQLIEPPIRIT